MRLQATMARVFVAAICVMAFSTLAEAQATRTWVSGVGDDANPCSRTAPCKTFAGAISKTAASGVISVLDPGGFGAVTITKNMTLDAEGTLGSILNAGTNGIIISGGTALAPLKVVLRNIHIDGAGSGLNGIQVTSGFVILHVDNVHINGETVNGINFSPSIGGAINVNRSFIHSVTQTGIVVANARGAVNQTTVEGSGKGILAGASGIVTVLESTMNGNGEGFASTNASAVFNIQNSIASHNQFGISAGGGSTFRLKNCGIFSNSNTGLFNGGAGSQIISHGGNSVDGNPTNGVFTSTVLPQ